MDTWQFCISQPWHAIYTFRNTTCCHLDPIMRVCSWSNCIAFSKHNEKRRAKFIFSGKYSCKRNRRAVNMLPTFYNNGMLAPYISQHVQRWTITLVYFTWIHSFLLTKFHLRGAEAREKAVKLRAKQVPLRGGRIHVWDLPLCLGLLAKGQCRGMTWRKGLRLLLLFFKQVR